MMNIKQNTKKYISFLCIAVLLITSFTFKTAKAAPADPLDIKGESAILVDGQSGRILYQKNIDASLPPASMTKMISEYIVLESIKSGKINWDQKLSISDYVYGISQSTKLSNVPLRKDMQYSVKELYESMAIYSANASTIALAELIAGSETNFIKMMSDKAAQLGMKDCKFVNCTGLNNNDLMGKQPAGTGPADENMMSARSVATLAYRLIHDYPEVLNTSSIPTKVFREGTTDSIKMDNWNWMLPKLVYGYDGVDGLKTGSTDLGGYSFTATAKRGQLRLISVVMKTASYEARFGETKKMLDYGFSNFASKELFPSGYKISSQAELPVVNGSEIKVGVESQKALVLTVKNGEDNLFEPLYQIDKTVTADKTALSAPLGKGQAIGYLTANYKGTENYGYIAGSNGDKVPLITSAAVKKASWLTMFFRSIGKFISNLFGK